MFCEGNVIGILKFTYTVAALLGNGQLEEGTIGHYVEHDGWKLCGIRQLDMCRMEQSRQHKCVKHQIAQFIVNLETQLTSFPALLTTKLN